MRQKTFTILPGAHVFGAYYINWVVLLALHRKHYSHSRRKIYRFRHCRTTNIRCTQTINPGHAMTSIAHPLAAVSVVTFQHVCVPHQRNEEKCLVASPTRFRPLLHPVSVFVTFSAGCRHPQHTIYPLFADSNSN